MSVLPAKGDAVLIVDPNTVPTGLIAFQPFQSIPGRDHQIVQASSGVNQFQFALNDTPEVFGNPPGRSGISLAEQGDGRVVGERLNHIQLHITRLTCNRQVRHGAFRPAIAREESAKMRH
jgi:hypothetical protein